jgi:hypothetical protein
VTPQRYQLCQRQGGVALFDGASKRAHSKRCASAKVPFGIAAAQKLRRLDPATQHGPRWKSVFQRDASTTG